MHLIKRIIGREKRFTLLEYGACLVPIYWGMHVLYYSQKDLVDVKSYSWVGISPWLLAFFVMLLGFYQGVANYYRHTLHRRVASLVCGATMFEFAVKVFGIEPHAPGSAVDLACASQQAIVFGWLCL